MAKRVQPAWNPPERKNVPVLKLYNSLTRQKEEFVPQYGNRVLWYSCGPTVYDASHMGHARSYISFDIMRRILQEYFNYDVLYVMNITDIDDKIIKRARQNHLYDTYINENNSLEQITKDVAEVMLNFEEKIRKTTDPDKKCMLEKMQVVLQESIKKLDSVIDQKNNEFNREFKETLLKDIKDPLSDWLDSKKGDTVDEHSIFNKLSQKWEEDYHEDMNALNVLKPNVLTRVSEYVPEIVAFIEKIIANGFAYESNGSVYFDVKAFDKKEKHYYAKLVPEAYGDTSSLQEGEGDLSVSAERLSEKHSITDFALWKSSKAGEPWWNSPWGKGRPGWHIECSVMASAICGGSLDIHTGGVDLKFPHHDNELAQAEAYFDNSHWVRYFLHSGHLTISGCKMSKSLKNFITIKEALKKHTSRQLRLAFLLHSWKDTLDYGDATMEMAVQYEKFLNEFFLNVKCRIRKINHGKTIEIFDKWSEMELDMNNKFFTAKDNIHAALCDNIDTRTALDVIRELVTNCNIYLKDCPKPNTLLLRDISVYITKILTIFGAISEHDSIGFPNEGDISSANLEEKVMPYLEILSDFREKVRTHARTLKANDILTECDRLRDDTLPNLGVRLEDDSGSGAQIKLVDRELLLREREAKKKIENAKAAEKERKKIEAEKAAAIKDAQRKIPPEEMFRNEEDKYSQWDDKGLPTHDAKGQEISKGLSKKLQKLQQQQAKKYQEYIEQMKNLALNEDF
ncbi:cysteine--tRNA ligase, cytoplasmic isoform X2 [Trichogramma pretiosum]|uniref:cysteine--tRNA ligase, cytoplasmic isoform X2 n=1 Tax=Trichogramma pretiosum TaxID=7493 RepID=UPI000C718EA2|nr:cysteine--tRNA ligase, cytoplasmic isoform X2 [Trichogramma pretiosum]